MPIIPEILTPESFSRFGDVVDVASAGDKRIINDGNTIRHHDLASLALTSDDGTPLISIFRSSPLPLPMTLTMMECHPMSSQTFYPLSGNPYLVVVAPAGKFQESHIKVFKASCDQGVNYHPGTWHHYSLALNEISDFLVIDRGGPEVNCTEVTLVQSLVLDLTD